jgi:tetratricopeptide (TPR) repeat protein
MKLGDALWAAGRLPDAETALEEALEVARRTGRARSIATVLTQLATVRSLRGDLTGARTTFAAVLELVEGAGASEELAGSHAVALTNLAEVEFNAGSVARAIELAARALELSRNQGDRRNMSLLCCNLAGYLARAGSFDEARARAREALDLLAEDRQSFLVASAAESLAHASIAAGDAARAARLAGFAEARRTALGAAREAGESENFERLMTAINAVLEGATADALLSEGSRLSVDEAVRLALEG